MIESFFFIIIFLLLLLLLTGGAVRRDKELFVSLSSTCCVSIPFLSSQLIIIYTKSQEDGKVLVKNNLKTAHALPLVVVVIIIT